MKILQYRECPNCGRMSPYIQVSCGCGHRFVGSERMYKTCPYCGSLNPASKILCDCGHFVLFSRSKLTEADVKNAYHSGVSDGILQERQRSGLELSEFFEAAKLRNTFTGQPIRSLEDFRQWKTSFDKAKAERERFKRPQEPVYLMEDKDGFLVRVPESKLESWQQAQREPSSPLNKTEQRLVDKIVESIYGSQEKKTGDSD